VNSQRQLSFGPAFILNKIEVSSVFLLQMIEKDSSTKFFNICIIHFRNTGQDRQSEPEELPRRRLHKLHRRRKGEV